MFFVYINKTAVDKCLMMFFVDFINEIKNNLINDNIMNAINFIAFFLNNIK